jgi:ribulose-bisphosphate carboxylase large chain
VSFLHSEVSPVTIPERIHASYRIRCRATEIARFAHQIAYEQTVELPERLVSAFSVPEVGVGRVERIEADGDRAEQFIVGLSYSPHLSSNQLSQLLNLLYGNVSIFPNVRLLDVRLPGPLLDELGGPSHGIKGVRRLLGVYGRPLLATALKPRGASIDFLASLAQAFALGGGDIIKDDHNLVDDHADDFKRRVEACSQAVERANAQSGRRCVYFPHLSARLSDLPKYLDFVRDLGLQGILVCPMIVGMETMRACARDQGLIVMAHPSMTGGYTEARNHGITRETLLGKLFRLAGADISIFPNFGGRFSFTRAQCLGISERLLEPLGNVTPAFPCPAGGMQYSDLAGMSKDYGEDAVFLVGASLLQHSENVVAGTRAFQHAIASHFKASLSEPRDTRRSLHTARGVDDAATRVLHYLAFREGFRWEGRHGKAYKDSTELPFRGIRRVELTGQHGEKTAFDLRYFEVAPGGYSSREKHRHTHVIICIRGSGTLVLGERRVALEPFDVAYIEPFKVHQLRNERSEPFGFFCLVDHARDRPTRP